jgi:WD40-like Beta Propeller Repeat
MSLTAATAGAASLPVFKIFGSAAQPSFGFIGPLAIDQSGDVLVGTGASGGTLSRYNPDGTPDDFTALGTNVIDGQGPGDGTPQGELNFNQNANRLQVAVDNSGTATDGNIYVVQGSVVDIFSSAGNYLGQLTAAGGSDFGGVCGVAVDPKGNVYVGGGAGGGVHKFDPVANPPVNADNVANFSGKACNVAAGAGPTACYVFAVEGNDGDLNKRNASTGKLAYTLDSRVSNVAVDPVSGRVYALVNVSGGQEVRTYDASGASPSRLDSVPAPGSLNGIAVDGSTGTPYVTAFSDGHVEMIESVIVPDVTTGTASAGLSSTTIDGTVNSAGIDPVDTFTDCHFEYVTEAAFEEHEKQGGFTDLSSGGSIPCESSDGNPISGAGEIPHDADDHLVTATLSGLTPSTAYRFRLIAANSNGANPGSAVHFSTPGPPSLARTFVKDLTSTSVVLGGEANPHLLSTSYRFEYVDDATFQNDVQSAGPNHGFDHAATTPLGGGDLGAGENPLVVSAQLTGLVPGTIYHSRFEIENSSGSRTSLDHVFTTPASGLGLGFQLADNRAWEMVSPSNKFGGSIVHAVFGVTQATLDGEGIAFATVTSIEGDPDGNRAIDVSSVLSRRGVDGWSSKDITPPHSDVGPLRFGGEYKVFSPDLRHALLEQQGNTPLSIEASEETPYLRDNTDPAAYRPLVTSKEGYANVPPGTVFGGGGSAASAVAVRATNSDLDHPVLKSEKPLIAGAAPNSLYQWSEGQLQPISELPASEGGAVVSADAGSGSTSIRHAVSEDGARVFWGTGAALYVRDTVNQETGRLDVAQPGASEEGVHEPIFQGASADGTILYFTDSQQLTADASPAGSDLYRCEVGTVEGGSPGCASLIDVSAPIEGSAEAVDVLGMSPAFSDDGDRIYFVARGALDTAPNEAGDSALPGTPSLYLWEEGQGRRFIATLSERDRPDWGLARNAIDPSFARLSAASSPDGRYFAFMSERSLTGYDNRDATTGEPVEEVFRYDAVEDRLNCVSCDPSGASPVGKVSDPSEGEPPGVDAEQVWSGRWVAAILPEAQESEPTVGITFYRPRVVLDNGRVFFNAIDPLVFADSNGEWDVYQYEPTGVGDCTSSSSGGAIARSAGGCVSLLSSGTAEEEVSFFDASETGSDVFFLTPARLAVTDEDFELDIYDARVDGVPATLPVINECLGEACQAVPNPPNDPTPNSASFQGAGNVPSERCAAGKRKVTREGHSRCVAKKHRHKKKRSHKAKAKRATNNRRAGR